MKIWKIMFVVGSLAPALFAQPAAPVGAGAQPAVQSPSATTTETDSSAVRVESVWDFVVKGGPVMIPIALCSLIALTVIVERSATLRRNQIVPPDFIVGLVKTVQSTKDRQKGIEYCHARPTPLSAILGAAIKKLGRPLPAVEKQMQDEGERQIAHMRKRLRLLSVIASIAPLLGLLGTITGMITAFQTVAASAEALGRTELLAKGIYEAMITTAAGLMVAIPVLIAYHGISAKVDSLVHEMDKAAGEFLDHISQISTEPILPLRKTTVAAASDLSDDTDGQVIPAAAVLAVAE